MFVIRSALVVHGTSSAARAVACIKELEGAGHDVTVTDAAGRRLAAADLQQIAVASAAGAPQPAAA